MSWGDDWFVWQTLTWPLTVFANDAQRTLLTVTRCDLFWRQPFFAKMSAFMTQFFVMFAKISFWFALLQKKNWTRTVGVSKEDIFAMSFIGAILSFVVGAFFKWKILLFFIYMEQKDIRFHFGERTSVNEWKTPHIIFFFFLFSTFSYKNIYNLFRRQANKYMFFFVQFPKYFWPSFGVLPIYSEFSFSSSCFSSWKVFVLRRGKTDGGGGERR